MAIQCGQSGSFPYPISILFSAIMLLRQGADIKSSHWGVSREIFDFTKDINMPLRLFIRV